MSTEAAALLAAWLSPGYPVGAFAYSHGLEWAVQSGTVHDAASLEGWLRTVIGQGAGRADAILLAHAMRDPDDAELGALAPVLQPSAERRLESRAQGAAFAQVTAAAYPAPGLDGRAEPWPLALGRAAAAHGIPAMMVLPLAVQAFAANLVSAAVRLVPLGQTDGQRVLAALMPLCRAVAAEAAEVPLAAIGGCAMLSDVASMCHETQYTRLFRS